jgi:hypothetical protein
LEQRKEYYNREQTCFHHLKQGCIGEATVGEIVIKGYCLFGRCTEYYFEMQGECNNNNVNLLLSSEL